jgi:hypothetical protein
LSTHVPAVQVRFVSQMNEHFSPFLGMALQVPVPFEPGMHVVGAAQLVPGAPVYEQAPPDGMVTGFTQVPLVQFRPDMHRGLVTPLESQAAFSAARGSQVPQAMPVAAPASTTPPSDEELPVFVQLPL